MVQLSNISEVLTKEEIYDYLKNREIIVEPILDPRQINSISIDLRLDNYFIEFDKRKASIIDPAAESTNYFREVAVEFFTGYYILQPGSFVLGQTFEYIALPSYILGILDGRSSIARRGVVVHATASVVDPGFSGHLVFELINNGEIPVKLYPLMRIAKIRFFRIKETKPYEGQYLYQIRIKAPKPDYDTNVIVGNQH